MFKAVVIGYQYVDFQPANGEKINGYKVWFTREPENKHITGRVAASSWVTVERWNKLPLVIGNEYAACYNDKGKVSQFLPVEIFDFGM